MDPIFNNTNDEENNDAKFQLYVFCFVGCLCIIPKMLNFINANQSKIFQLCNPPNNNTLTEVLYRGVTLTGTPRSPETCPICIENFIINDKIVNLKCNHIFHYKCMREWYEKSKSCPTCRINI